LVSSFKNLFFFALLVEMFIPYLEILSTDYVKTSVVPHTTHNDNYLFLHVISINRNSDDFKLALSLQSCDVRNIIICQFKEIFSIHNLFYNYYSP